MKLDFIYYSTRVERDILSLSNDLLTDFYAMQKMMIEKGPNLGLPYTRAMGDGLFEMRLEAKSNIARVFYCTMKKNTIVILHSFIKKTRTTPDRELKLARKRLKEVKQNG